MLSAAQSHTSELDNQSPMLSAAQSHTSELDNQSPMESVQQSHISETTNQVSNLVEPSIMNSPEKSKISTMDQSEFTPIETKTEENINMTDEASPISNLSQNIDNESMDSEADKSQTINDEDAIAESIEGISQKQESIEDHLETLDQMDNVTSMDDQNESKSVISQISQHSSTLSPLNVSTSSPKSELTDVKTAIMPDDQTPQDFQEPLTNQPKFNQSTDEDVETVITDADNKPLTEGDKEIILDELEGKPIKANLHINHKSIESLHHINVYHYLPPKYIPAGSVPNVYPGMVPQQPQPMTPGPIINIHNSTTSNGGQKTNNAYDVGPDGKLHQMSSGTAQSVVNATPTQNWGQVVYSNTHHVATSNVSTTDTTLTSDTPSVANSNPNGVLRKKAKKERILLDNAPVGDLEHRYDDDWDKAFNSFDKQGGNMMDMDLAGMDPRAGSLENLAPSKFSEQINSFSGSPKENLRDMMGGMSEDDLLNNFVSKNQSGFQDDMEDEKALRRFEKAMNGKGSPILI
jgi:hypothetical protein